MKLFSFRFASFTYTSKADGRKNLSYDVRVFYADAKT